MTLRQDLKTCKANLAACKTASAAKDETIADLKTKNTTLQGKVTDLESQNASLQSVNDTLNAQLSDKISQISALNAKITDLQKQLDDCMAGGSSDFLVMPAGASPQAFLTSAGAGAKIQLPATLKLSGTLTPLPKQHLRGPCTITPATNLSIGINCKTKLAKETIFENLDMSGFGLRALVPWEGTVVKGGRYHHNGEMGIGCDTEGAIIEVITLDSIEVDHNGKDEFIGHGAAGVKFFHVNKTKLINVNSHDNTGNGLWWDAECGYADVIGGVVENNLKKGVFWEKCGGNHGDGWVNPLPGAQKYAGGGVPYDGMLTVKGVRIQNNNRKPDGSVDSVQGNAGIYSAGSKNINISNCTFGGNTRAIIIRNDQDRLLDDHAGWVVSNVTIDDSSNKYNGDDVAIGNDVTGVTRT